MPKCHGVLNSEEGSSRQGRYPQPSNQRLHHSHKPERLGSGDGEEVTTMNTTDSNRAVACIRFVRRLRVHWTFVEWLRECSLDEIEDGERWQRWETIFAVIKFRCPRRQGEPRFYKWSYDGRPRWNLSLGSTRIQWGCAHEDFYSPNIGLSDSHEIPPQK